MKVGDVIDGKYELVRLIGEGGMGSVWEAWHVRIRSKRAAVKVLHSDLATNPELIARFEREAEAAAAIGHDGIIDVYDLGRGPDGAPFLVMEFLEGRSLAGELNDDEATGISEPLSMDLSVFVACSTLLALSAAHEAGIVHRDLKPDNIFLVETGSARPKVKLLDFGIARIIEPSDDRRQNTLTKTGAVMGTPFFMSPEQALGYKKKIDQRTDIWATGVILYKCVTGQYPFEGANYNQVMAQIISEHEPADPSVLNPDVPAVLEAIIARALCKDADQRYQTAAEMLDDLRPLLGQGDLGLLEFQCRRSSKRSIPVVAVGVDGAAGTELPGVSSTSRASTTPLSAVFETKSKPRRLLLPALVVGLVVALAAVSGVAVYFWVGAGIHPGEAIRPPPRPAATAPIAAPPAPRPAPMPLPAPATPVVQPQPQVPPAGIAPTDVVQHPAPRSPEPSVAASQPAGGEADAAPPAPPEQPVEARPPEERTGAERRAPERPRIQPDDRRPPEPPRYPTTPPPNYGRELPQGATPVYGREL